MSAADGSSPEKLGAFSKFWRDYWKAGLAPVPARPDKRPATYRPKRPLSEATLSALAQKHPTKPIGIWTGELSGVDVIDVDKGDGSVPIDELVAMVEARCGKTPIHVRTRSGGRHLWYSHTPGTRCEKPSGAKRKAFPVDVKANGGFAMAPGSPGYVLEKGDLDDVIRLPRVNSGSLPLHFKPRAQAVEWQRGAGKAPEGERDTRLFPMIRTAVLKAETDEDAYRGGHRLNADICDPPMPAAEVDAKVKWALDKKRKGDLLAPGCEPSIIITRSEHDRFLDDPYAYVLWAQLRFSHEVQPDKQFKVAVDAMRRSIPGMASWPKHKAWEARKRLIKSGDLRLIRKGVRGQPDLFQGAWSSRSVSPAGLIQETPLPSRLVSQGATTTASGPASGQARLGGKPPYAPSLPVPETFVSAGFHASPAVPGGSVGEHLQHPANQSNLEGGVIRRARIFGEALEQSVKPKPVPADPWGGFVERVTRHHGMTRNEAWMLAQALGGDDVPAAMLACLEAAETAGRSARRDLSAFLSDAPRAEDPAGGLVREPVQTDWVEQISGDKRAAVPTQTEAREWLAEQRLSQRQAAMLAGMPSGTFQTWINGRRPLPPEHAARLWAAMNATKAA